MTNMAHDKRFESIEDELAEIHFGKSRRDRDQVADHRQEPADKNRN